MTVKDLNTSHYGIFYAGYIQKLPKEASLMSLFLRNKQTILDFFSAVPVEKHDYFYAEGKWTIKEVLLHLIDTERILTYRALRFARNDKTELPGFDQDAYVPAAYATIISMEDLLEQYVHVRNSTISLFKNFSEDVLKNTGQANGNPMSVAAAGFIVLGHELHHLEILKERYLK